MLLHAKKKCYPDKGSIIIKDTSAKVNLQALVKRTAKRIVETQKGVFNNFYTQELTVMYKRGYGGSAGHSTYKQRFSSEDNKTKTDFYLFSIAITLNIYI